MRLSKKTFCYSISMALVLVIFVALYFAFMLPSLYVRQMEQNNLDSIVEVQKGYIKDRSYEDLVVKNPTGSATIEIPLSGNKMYIAGKAFRIEIEIKDAEVQDMINELRELLIDIEDNSEELEFPDIDIDLLKEKIFPDNHIGAENLATINIFTSEEVDNVKESKAKTHRISDSLYVFEGGITDGDNEYSSYIAFSETKDAIVFSFLSVVTPGMKEIRPIVLESLPMIIAVVLFLVLVFSQVFARKIVNPIIRLADYAEEVKIAGNLEISPLPINEKDEIGELGDTLNELYTLLRQQYHELEQKNQKLASENKRQEVFLRASSHQLKTPITAALLLAEGMMDEVGKYKDTKIYLPEVKKQLQSMRKIVEDILYLNHCTENIQKEYVDMEQLINEVVGDYYVQIKQNKLHIENKGSMSLVLTDREITKKILDNVICNAVCYTPRESKIEIHMESEKLLILNRGGVIEVELLPHIYQPFVSSNTNQKGRGLGLYIASYYAEVLGVKLGIENTDEGVVVTVVF